MYANLAHFEFTSFFFTLGKLKSGTSKLRTVSFLVKKSVLKTLKSDGKNDGALAFLLSSITFQLFATFRERGTGYIFQPMCPFWLRLVQSPEYDILIQLTCKESAHQILCNFQSIGNFPAIIQRLIQGNGVLKHRVIQVGRFYGRLETRVRYK